MKMSLSVIFQRKWKSELFKSSLDNLSTFTHYSKRSENVVTFQSSLFFTNRESDFKKVETY